ncbi:MAG: signal recognition particle-docking protein FtsY [Alphaproteobacteria bacterium]|nr:signal recognition particle-docking protein FtsY [Alphaproteobacteria bacterium]
MAESERRTGWLGRLRQGLARTAAALGTGLGGVFVRRRLDRAALEELEEILIRADLGVATAAAVTERLAATRFDREVTEQEIRQALADEVAAVLGPVAVPLVIDTARRPHVVLVTGVNGTGKTTTIGKMASRFRREGRTVSIAAGDTFRAAAIEQLKVWAERSGAKFFSRAQGSDAAGLAFDALTKARADGDDVLLIDTAGRLQNKAGLMEELRKIVRVLRKVDATAPHTVLLVLDATTGQNVLNQVELFRDVCEVSGLIMTKLDGTAKGGVLVAVAAKFGLPIHAIGVGESIDDLQPFDATAFGKALVGQV